MPSILIESCKDHGEFMDDNTRYKFLYYHDGPRMVLALGESPDNDYGFLPPAKNLFRMRWNCTLEKQARDLIKNCPANVTGAPEKGMNLYHHALTGTTDKYAKYQFISDAVDYWLLPTDTYALGPNATFTDENLYTFANMAYQKIYEVGCHYEQCGSGGSVTASAWCIYNT
ncbi:SCP-like protein [Cooperia oncophora]